MRTHFETSANDKLLYSMSEDFNCRGNECYVIFEWQSPTRNCIGNEVSEI